MENTNQVCEYGCGKTSQFALKNGKKCCSKSPNQCEKNKQRNADGLKQAYATGKREKKVYFKNINWAKGKTVLSDNRIKSKYSIDEIFCVNSIVRTDRIKILIIKENIIEYSCEKCRLKNEWNGEKITLELDHINGNNNDNRIENLRFLCPNCHSQTPTYKGKNLNKYNKIKDDIIIDFIKKGLNIRQILIKVGLVPKGGNYARIKKLMIYYETQRFVLVEKIQKRKRVKKYNSPAEYHKMVAIQNFENIHKERINLIINSNIDFSKFGWVQEVAKLFKIPTQGINKWFKKYMPKFYNEECFKRKNALMVKLIDTSDLGSDAIKEIA